MRENEIDRVYSTHGEDEQTDNSKGRNHFGDLDGNKRTIFKCIIQKFGKFIYQLSYYLSSSQGLCSTELVRNRICLRPIVLSLLPSS
jgi:hypothetical protein